MKIILVRYYNPSDVIDVTPETTEQEMKEYCFRVNRYDTELQALYAYAETPAVWSTLLEHAFDSKDVERWIDEAFEHIKNNDFVWLENNFV